MKKTYPLVRDKELAAAFKYTRNDPRFAHLMSPKKTLRVDWFLLRAIHNKIAERRTPTSKLALLTGTVVREFVPDVNKATRELGEAYRNATMEIFRQRKKFQRASKQSVKATEHPEQQDHQLRLV